jgi:hypothetical protein
MPARAARYEGRSKLVFLGREVHGYCKTERISAKGLARIPQ